MCHVLSSPTIFTSVTSMHKFTYGITELPGRVRIPLCQLVGDQYYFRLWSILMAIKSVIMSDEERSLLLPLLRFSCSELFFNCSHSHTHANNTFKFLARVHINIVKIWCRNVCTVNKLFDRPLSVYLRIYSVHFSLPHNLLWKYFPFHNIFHTILTLLSFIISSLPTILSGIASS